MNKKIVYSLVLALLAIAPSAIAGSYDYLRVDHIGMPYGYVSDYFPVKVQVANADGREAEDVHVRTWLPLFSDMGYGMIEKIEGSSPGKLVFQDIPDGTPKGEYWVRITVSNDDERRVKYRLVDIY